MLNWDLLDNGHFVVGHFTLWCLTWIQSNNRLAVWPDASASKSLPIFADLLQIFFKFYRSYLEVIVKLKQPTIFCFYNTDVTQIQIFKHTPIQYFIIITIWSAILTKQQQIEVKESNQIKFYVSKELQKKFHFQFKECNPTSRFFKPSERKCGNFFS